MVTVIETNPSEAQPTEAAAVTLDLGHANVALIAINVIVYIWEVLDRRRSSS